MKRCCFLFIFLLLAGCSSSTTPNNNTDHTLMVYTSIYPLQYAAEQIAGEDASVVSIYPPGVDAHTYEPSTKEVTHIAEGDVFLYLGAGMESFAGSIKNALEMQPIEFVSIEEENPDLFENADEQHHEHGDEHHHGDQDPHIWLDPIRMIAIGEIIKDELIGLLPDDEEVFQENFAAFKQDMETLDATFHHTLNDKKDKHLLVTHAAYGYWKKAYGIDQIAISGISSSDEPSQKELTNIAKMANDHHIDYVIFEKNSSNKVASIIQDYIGADQLEIHNLEVLTEEETTNKEDYMSLMEQNLQVLDKATK